jgi:hypothetical protein
LKSIEFLINNTKGISLTKVEDTLGEFSSLSLFELENIRCTSAQHNIVNFMIEFRKSNDGMLPFKNDNAVKQIDAFYRDSLTLNSPSDKDMVL